MKNLSTGAMLFCPEGQNDWGDCYKQPPEGKKVLHNNYLYVIFNMALLNILLKMC